MALRVEKIENGTVIDHISPGFGQKVLNILNIESTSNKMIAFLINATSKSQGKKDILKLESIHLNKKQIEKIAIISPSATINIIENGKIKEKIKPKLPKEIKTSKQCPNPKCITHFEEINSYFLIENEFLRCFYCERRFTAKEVF